MTTIQVGDKYRFPNGRRYTVTEVYRNRYWLRNDSDGWSAEWNKEEMDSWASYRVKPDEDIITVQQVETSDVDVVNHPSHYKFENGVEVIDLTEQLNFNCGNVVKYTARAGRKDATKQLEDLRKAEFYIKREIKRVETAGENL